MPVLDFDDNSEYDAAVAFLLREGIPFHTSLPQRIMLTAADYRVLAEAKILHNANPKVTSTSGKKSRSSTKPKTRRAS